MTDEELDELEAKAIAAKEAAGCERSLQTDTEYIKASRPWRILDLIEDLRQIRKERDWIISNVVSNGNLCPCFKEGCPVRTHLARYVALLRENNSINCINCWLKTAKEATK